MIPKTILTTAIVLLVTVESLCNQVMVDSLPARDRKLLWSFTVLAVYDRRIFYSNESVAVEPLNSLPKKSQQHNLTQHKTTVQRTLEMFIGRGNSSNVAVFS